jgi:hypothetical protein
MHGDGARTTDMHGTELETTLFNRSDDRVTRPHATRRRYHDLRRSTRCRTDTVLHPRVMQHDDYVR